MSGSMEDLLDDGSDLESGGSPDRARPAPPSDTDTDTDTVMHHAPYDAHADIVDESPLREMRARELEREATRERDEIQFTLQLYEGLSSLPRKEFVRKLANIASILENIEDPAMHLWQLEELMNQYLEVPKLHGPPTTPPTDPTTLPSLIGASPEFTIYFLDNALPTIVRHLIARSFSSFNVRPTSLDEANGNAIVERVNQFFQAVLRVIAKHLAEPTKPVVMTLPVPVPPPAPVTTLSSATAGAPAAVEPVFVTAPVGPLFPDSISCSLVTTLQRIFDRERQFYYFYDRKGLGKADDDDGLDLSDDDDAEATVESISKRLIPEHVERLHNLTVEQYALKLLALRKTRQAMKEKERAAKIEAAIALEKRIEELKPAKLYSLSPPGKNSHGLLQRNIQFFGTIGGFELIAQRFSSGINPQLDSRVPVCTRGGLNPAQNTKLGFYRKEMARRVAWSKICAARGEQYSAAPPTPPRGSFPSIAPYLVPACFTNPGTAPPIPLHRVRIFMEAILKVQDFLSPVYFQDIGARIKDAVIVRLLHIRPEESRLCDKEYLQNVLQNFLWLFIYHLCCIQKGSTKVVDWPMLDPESQRAWSADKQTLLDIEEAKAAAAASDEESDADGVGDDASPVVVAPPVEIPEIPPPPLLYEVNLNADELMECITIYLSYQLFCSALLEKRINGLMDINRMVDLTLTRQRLDHPPEGVVAKETGGARIPVTAWMNMEVLSNYLLQIRIMDELFGTFDASQPINTDKSTHPQLIQRCDEIIKYLALLEKLTPHHLRQVWAASQGKHETIIHAIYTLIGACVQTFNLEHIQLILAEFVPSIPLSEWSEHTLRLVVSLMSGGDDEDEEAAIIERGVAIMWRVMTLPRAEEFEIPVTAASPSAFPPALTSPTTDVSFYLKQACARQIYLLLAKGAMEPLRRTYITRILGLLRLKTSTGSRGMLLWLLPSLLFAYPNLRTQPDDLQRWRVLQGLLDKEKLFFLLLDDLARYTSVAGAAFERVREAILKKHPKRKTPDPTLIVLGDATPGLTGGPKDQAAKNAAFLGIAISDLDASVSLPASLESSVELLTALKALHAPSTHHSAATAQTAAASSTLTMTRSNSSSSHSSLPFSESFSYEMEVLLRLELLRFLAAHSYSTFNAQHLDQLWNGAVTQAVSADARAHFFHWLRTVHSPKPQQTPVLFVELQEAALLQQAAAVGTHKYTPSFVDPTRYSKALSDESLRHLFQTHLSNPSSEWLANMDEAAFMCWRHYFLVINEQMLLVRLHAPLAAPPATAAGPGVAHPIKFYVQASAQPLVGLEYLWSICLHAQKQSVVDLASDLLIQAHAGSAIASTDAADAEAKYVAREQYIARCMEFMQADNAADAGHSARLLRCLSLLHSFMQTCAAHENEEEKHLLESDVAAAASTSTATAPASATTGAPFTIDVQIGAFVPDAEEVLRVSAVDGQTVRQLKELISGMLTLPASKMSLHFGNTELLNYQILHAFQAGPLVLRPPTNRSNIQHKENDRPMEEDEDELATLQLARAFTPAVVLGNDTPLPSPATDPTYSAFPSASASGVPGGRVHRNPTQLLSNHQGYFETLFSLLSSSSSSSSSSSTESEISQRVWQLITSLPTNQKLMDEMRTLACVARATAASAASLQQASPWSQLLDPSSPFKLLYSLRIISKLAAPHLAPAGKAASSTSSKMFINAIDWRNKFLKLGGAEYLYTILIQLLEKRALAHTKGVSAVASSVPAVEWDESRNACLALLLKLFNFFLISAQAHSNRAILYLLPGLLPDMDTRLLNDTAGQDQLMSLMRGLSGHASFLNQLNFGTLAREALQLLTDCAKSAAKQHKLSQSNHAVSAKTRSSIHEEANLDEFLIKHAMVLLSACVLHQPSHSAPESADPTPLSILTSSASSTVYSTLLFLCPASISHEASEDWLQLALHFKAHATSVSPLTLHRFLLQDVLLRCLPTLVSSARYAGVAQDYFQLVDFILRDLLDHELDADVNSKIMPGFDWHSFFMRLVGYMRSRPIHEAKHASSTNGAGKLGKAIEHSCDEVLVGLMDLVSTLLTKLPVLKDLIFQRPHAHSLELDELMSELTVSPVSPASGGPITVSLADSPSPPPHNVAAGLLEEVFLYLFDLPTLATAHLPIQAPKAKRRTTRISAFNLLLQMVTGHSGNFHALSGLLYRQNIENNNVHHSGDWEYSPEEHTKSNTGHVGLINAGSTCYLNSMMQQLFMIPNFRRKLLAINVPNPSGGGGRGTTGNVSISLPADPSEHLLFQVQFMFGFLEASSRKAFNTANFCKAFKDYEGKAIDVRVQQDVDEFFNAFCDRLEAALKDNHKLLAETGSVSAHACETDLVKSTFGGELEHQLIGAECPHRSFRSEPFFALPLNVKGKSSIAASLENFCEGEMLEGDNAYMCHSCVPPRKVRTFKRVCIKTLPQVLVLNLKRFEFNYDSMLKMKLNDSVSFPTEPGALSMDDFTKEGLLRKEEAAKNHAPEPTASATDDESKSADAEMPQSSPLLHTTSSSYQAAPATPAVTYSLVGVLLHSGGSESGHYTSLVKDRSSSSSRWLHFNDSVVHEFDGSQLAAECFGGMQTVSVWDTRLRRKVVKEVEKTRSAYLLIYERDPPAGKLETPLNSPLRPRPDSKTAAAGAFAFGPDSPKVQPSHFPTGRARTPNDPQLRRSPSSSPPPAHLGPRNLSGSSTPSFKKRLEFATGSSPSLDAADSDSFPPSHSPSFSRAASMSEHKVPEFSLGPSSVPMTAPVASGTPQIGTMPPQIYETIWEENIAFLKNSQLFQLVYFKFIVAFLQLAPPPSADGEELRGVDGMADPTVLRARRMEYGLPSVLGCEEEVRHMQLASIFLTDVLAHAKYITNPVAFDRERSEEETPTNAGPKAMRHLGGRTGSEQRHRMCIDSSAPHSLLPTYKALLLRFFSNHIPAACWFVRDHLLGHRHNLRYFLFECSSEFMRDYLSDVFAMVLGVLVPVERPLYDKTDSFDLKAPTTSAVSAPNSPAGVSAAAAVQTIHMPRAFGLQLIDQLMLMLKDVPLHWRSLSPYFSLLHSFACMGYNERMYLLNTHNMIPAIVDLLLGNASPYARDEKYKRPIMGDAETWPNFFDVYRLLSLVVRSALLNPFPDNHQRSMLPPTLLTIEHGTLPLPPAPEHVAMDTADSNDLPLDAPSRGASGSSSRSRTAPSSPARGSRDPSYEQPPSTLVLHLPPASEWSVSTILSHTHTLNHEEVRMIFNEIFLRKTMKEGLNLQANIEILTHLAWDEDPSDAFICRHLLKLIEDANYDRLDPLFALLPRLLALPDSLQAVRIERYLNAKSGLVSKAAYFQNQYPLFTYYVLKFIFLQLGQMQGPVQDYLVRHRAALYWGFVWIQRHHDRTLTKSTTIHARPLLPMDGQPDGAMSPPGLQRQISTYDTVAAIADWFGPEFLAERAEITRRDEEAAAAAHQARLTARGESFLDPSIARGSYRGEAVGDSSLASMARRHANLSNNFDGDSDDSQANFEADGDSDDDANLIDDDFLEEEQRLIQILAQPQGELLALKALHSFKYRHQRLDQLKEKVNRSVAKVVPQPQPLLPVLPDADVGVDTDVDTPDADSGDVDVDLDSEDDVGHRGIAPDPLVQEPDDIDTSFDTNYWNDDDDPIAMVAKFEAEEAQRLAAQNK